MRATATAISERRRGGWRALALGLGLAAACACGAAAQQRGKPPPRDGAAAGPTFVRLPPIVLPVFEDNRVARQAGLALALELEPGKTPDDLAPNQRRLYDAFITDLYKLYDQHRGTAQLVDARLVKQRLKATCDRILGPGIVHEVLIEQAYERGPN